MATVNIIVKGTVGSSHIVKPLEWNNGGTPSYTITIEKPTFELQPGADPTQGQAAIQWAKSRITTSEKYPTPAIFMALQSHTRNGKEQHVNYWDNATKAQVPVEHDIGRGQEVTVAAQIYDTTSPMAKGGKTMKFTDVLFDNIKNAIWYVPGASAMFSGFKPLTTESNPNNVNSSIQTQNPATPNQSSVPFNNNTQPQNPFNGQNAGQTGSAQPQQPSQPNNPFGNGQAGATQPQSPVQPQQPSQPNNPFGGQTADQTGSAQPQQPSQPNNPFDGQNSNQNGQPTNPFQGR